MKTITPEQAKEIKSCAPKKPENAQTDDLNTDPNQLTTQNEQLTQAEAERLAAQNIASLRDHNH